MNLNKLLLLILLVVSGTTFGQASDEKLIHGKAVSDSVSVEGINVINLVNEKSTVTDKNGEFYILAKAEDLLVLTAVNFEYKRRLIEAEDLKSEIITIPMIPKVTALKEVIVNGNPNINAESLGIIPKGQKKFTPAERKLYTAQSGPVDILANLISGRTKMLKKEVEVEKKEMLLAKLDIQYDDRFYTETLKIPEGYIKGFQYYAIENQDFVAALQSKNKTMMRFQIAKLAGIYNEIIKPE